MPDIIQFATGEELAALLAETGQQVSGMTPQEAYNALHMVESGKMVSGNITTGGTKIIEFTQGSAAEAVEGYIANGGAVSSTGAATSSASTTANLTVVKGASGAAGVAGILTMSLPTWTAAVAPLLGVALGTGLYSLSPDFWEKVSRAVLPFAWSDTKTMPAVADSNGQVYIEGAALEALRHTLDEDGFFDPKYVISSPTDLNGPLSCAGGFTGINTESGRNTGLAIGINSFGGVTRILATESGVPIKATIAYITPHKGYYLIMGSTQPFKFDSICRFDASGVPKVYSSAPSIEEHTYTRDGKKVYYATCGLIPQYDIEPLIPTSPSQNLYLPKFGQYISWSMYYDVSEEIYDYPEGVERWGGDIPVDYTSGGIDVVVDKNGNTSPYYPVTLPVGDVPPGTSNNPETVPVPTVPTPLPEITPYVPPVVNPDQYPVEIPYPDGEQNSAPITNPIPNTTPNLDPSIDPSKKPDPAPDPEPSPETNPSSGGSSPPAIFPPVGAFPSIIPSSGSGLIHVYNPTPEEMISFGHWLWVTYADASIQKLWNNPFDGVISAHELYATPSVDGRDNIRSGFLTCPTSANIVRVRYNQINCGSIVIPEWYANYLDYSPYTKASVYLPFIGIVELDSDDIVGHGVNITYTIDSYNGSCIAQITVAKQGYNNTVYQFSGNCSVELPLAGGSQAAIKAGMISAAATGITSVIGGVASLLTGNVPGAIGGIAHGVGSAVSTAVSQKSTVQHSGSFGASYGAMGIKKPYLIIRRPIQKQVINYNEEYGFPAHKRVLIGSCSGYLRAKEVHVVSPTATDEEKAMIERLLKEGVFVS